MPSGRVAAAEASSKDAYETWPGYATQRFRLRAQQSHFGLVDSQGKPGANRGGHFLAVLVGRLNSSTVTRKVAVLEDELGLTLLEFGRCGVRLTSGGEAERGRMIGRAAQPLVELDER
ncbi:MAG: hypothetical protein QOK38_3628 [Acidobacteriaceae bacterium]|nr:hypothetical protein [Acidobacteriaceae bacterium]